MQFFLNHGTHNQTSMIQRGVCLSEIYTPDFCRNSKIRGPTNLLGLVMPLDGVFGVGEGRGGEARPPGGVGGEEGGPGPLYLQPHLITHLEKQQQCESSKKIKNPSKFCDSES